MAKSLRSVLEASFCAQSSLTNLRFESFLVKKRNGHTFRYDHSSPGGEGGIRTLDTVARILLFESSAFNHSATSPSS